MVTGSLGRGLAILRRLVGERDGVAVSVLAEDLDLPKSAVHRLLTTLADEGLVQQSSITSRYELTLELASMGLRHLADSTINQIAAPLLDKLAHQSGQLVRLGLVDQDRLVWVAKAQGARTGLRYDPDHGAEIPLALSASGIAWLSTLPEDTAMRLVASQDLAARHATGAGAPRSITEVMRHVARARQRGWATVEDSVEVGISAMATPVITELDAGPAHAVVSIAGPSMHLTEHLMTELAPSLVAAAREIAVLAPTQHTSVPPTASEG